MAGFQKSPEFNVGGDVLMHMAEIDGLANGYAIFSPDLSTARWAKDETTAIWDVEIGEYWARVPEVTDDSTYGHASLLAGLTYQLEMCRHIVEEMKDDPEEDRRRYGEPIERIGYHLFGWGHRG